MKKMVPAVASKPLLLLLFSSLLGICVSLRAKVAFIDDNATSSHGDFVPKKVSRRISPKQLNHAIHRALCLDTFDEVDENFSVGNLFDRQQANIVFFVDGLQSDSSLYDEMPFLSSVFNNPDITQFTVLTSNKHQSSILQDTLSYIDFKGLSEIRCISIEGRLFETTTCQHSSRLLEPLQENLILETSTSVVEKEVQLLSEVSESVREAHTSGLPTLYVVYLSSLLSVSQQHGILHDVTIKAASQIDSALKNVIHPDSARSGDSKITAQIVAGSSLRKASRGMSMKNHGRRLATTTGSSSSATSTSSNSSGTVDYDLVDIVQYQLNMWTGVFLALLVFLALYGMVNMDIGRDSLLYAKFQADTSGKMD